MDSPTNAVDPLHPDQFDSPANAETTLAVLRKALPEGRMHRIPKHPNHRDIILAILCLAMQRRHAYTELEINDYLNTELAELQADVDHVTCRRYLVDLGFVKRDRAGNRYIMNYPKVESTLSGEVMASVHLLIAEAIAIQQARFSKPRTQ